MVMMIVVTKVTKGNAIPHLLGLRVAITSGNVQVVTNAFPNHSSVMERMIVRWG